MDTEVSDLGVKFTSVYLEKRLRMRGSVPQFSCYALMACIEITDVLMLLTLYMST